MKAKEKKGRKRLVVVGVLNRENLKKTLTRIFSSETLLITLATIGAYLYLYLYELGFCERLNIPQEFIEVSLSSLLKMASILALIVLVLQYGIDFIVVQLALVSSLKGTIKKVLVLLLQSSPVFLASYFISRDVLISVGIALLLCSLVFIFSFAKIGKVKSDMDRTLPAFLMLRFYGYLIIIPLFLSALIVFRAGVLRAKRKEMYLVLNTSPRLVVLTTYGDRYICSEFSNKELGTGFIIKTVGDISQGNIKIESERVGPLKIMSKRTESTGSPTGVPEVKKIADSPVKKSPQAKAPVPDTIKNK